jgi:hypothetical protein
LPFRNWNELCRDNSNCCHKDNSNEWLPRQAERFHGGRQHPDRIWLAFFAQLEMLPPAQ